MVRRHGEPEFADRVASIGQQALFERRIGPRLGDDARAIFGDPFFFDEMLGLFNELAGFQAALFECGLDCIGALLHGSNRQTAMGLIGHGRDSEGFQRIW